MSKVLLINGSPNEQGNTWTALNEVAGALDVSSISKWQVSRLDERLDVEAGDVSPPEIRRREVRLPVAPPT